MPWLALLALTALAPAAAQARLDMRVDLGFDETYAAGAWTPMRIVLENMPDANQPPGQVQGFRGEVIVDVQDLEGVHTEYVREIELPPQSRKQIEMQVMLSELGHSFHVRLRDERGKDVLVKDQTSLFRGAGAENLRQSVRRTPTVLLLARPLETMSYPTSLPVGAANIKSVYASDLPTDYRGYDAVRLLVVQHNLSELLEDEQLAAIDTWLHLGGRLAVIPTRHHAEIAKDAWLAERLPAAVEGVREVPAEALMEGGGEALLLATQWGEPAAASRVLWEAGGNAVALERPIGMGRVIGVGLDPSGAVSERRDRGVARNMRALLESLIFMPGPEDLRARHYWSTDDVDPDFVNIMILPNRFVVAGLITLFVIVAGPANFYYLKRKRRLELAWVTIPALSVAFFIAVYAYGVAAKGGDQHYASTEILHLGEGSSQGMLLWSAIQFSPSKQAYAMQPEGGGIMQPLLRYYMDPDTSNGWYPAPFGGLGPGSPRAPGIGGALARVITTATDTARLQSFVEQWKMAFYQGEAATRIDGKIEGEVILDENLALHVRLNNATGAALADARLNVGTREERLGDIEAGGRIAGRVTDLRRRNASRAGATIEEGDGKFHEKAEMLMRQGAVDSYPNLSRQAPQRRVRLMARQERWLSSVDIMPAPEHRKVCAMVEVDLPLRLDGEVGMSTDNFLRREIYAFDPVAVQFFSGMGDFADLASTEMEVLVGAPRLAAPVEFVSGTGVVRAHTGRERLIVHAYNYTTGAWDEAGALEAESEQVSVNEQKLEFTIQPEWMNPFDPSVRIKLVAQPTGENSGMFNRQYGGYGVAVEGVDATMVFRSE